MVGLQQWMLRTLMLYIARTTLAQAGASEGKDDANALAAKKLASATANSDSFVLVSYCVPWYEPCQKIVPELDGAEDTLESWASLIRINCDEAPSFCASQGVASYPTIRIFNGPRQSRYRGKLKGSSISTEVIRGVLPLVTQVDTSIAKRLMSLDIPLLMVTNEPGESKETDDAVYSAAKSLQGKFIVAATSEIGLSGIEAAQLPFVAVFNTQDETTPVYQGRLTTQALVGFAETVATPLVSRLDLTRLAECMKSGLPLGLIFAEEESERKFLADELMDVAFKFKGKINMATVDAKKLHFLAEPLGVDPGRYPAFALQSLEDAFVLDQGKSIDADAVERFIRELLPEPAMEL